MDKSLKDNIVNTLVKEKKYEDLYKLARFVYRYGDNLLSDSLYESLNNSFVKMNHPLVNQSYDDDEIPMDLVTQFNLNYLIFASQNIDPQLLAELDEDKSLSINALTSYGQAYNFLIQYKGMRFVLSGKINGINIKSLYINGLFSLGMTRGRNGDGFDVTKNASKVQPIKLLDVPERLIVRGEYVADSNALELLKNQNNESYITERGAAIGMLRTDCDNSLYKHLKYCAFNADGLSDTLSGTYEILEDRGFFVVPYIVVDTTDMPTDFNDFKLWLQPKMELIWNRCKNEGLETDGMVVEIDDLTYDGEIKGQYSDRNAAFKFDRWAFNYYKGVVKSIQLEQISSKCSVVAIIEPVKTSDGCMARRVNLHSPKIMINNNIIPGSTIYFKRDSGAINLLLYGEELEEKLNKGDD